MPLVADWATPADAEEGRGVLYTEAFEYMGAPALYVSRTLALDLATVMARDIPASLPESQRLAGLVADNLKTSEEQKQLIIAVWQHANRYRHVTGASTLQAAADELEVYLRDIYMAAAAPEAPRRGFPWKQVLIGAIVTLGVGAGARYVVNNYRGRRHAHGS